MLDRESHGSGWQVSLRAKGAGRFVVALFMGAWLCGWAVGEYFAGGTLLAGLRDLLAPDLDIPWLPHMLGRMPANPWPVLAFLGFWLTFWTIGGLFAMSEVLRALIGVDHVRWDHDGIEVVRRAGPFAARRRIAWADASEVFSQRRGKLVAHTRRGIVRLAGLGAEEERQQLADWLVAAWRDARGREGEALAAAEQVPAGWVVEMAEDGRPLLASHRGSRRVGALVLGVPATGLALAGAGIGSSAAELAAWVGVAVCSLLASLAAAGAVWLAFGQVELRPAPGRLKRVKRIFGREWARELSPARLQLERTRDSDGDDRWQLVASGPGGTLDLASDLHVPGAARHMGLWLAARMEVALEGLPETAVEQSRAG